MYNENFDGVFKFTNASNEEFVALWNNKEYRFPPQSTCPLIIPGETLENIQNIRKMFALKYAKRELFKSPQGLKIEKEGAKHFNPATYDEAILEQYVQQCLTPLPISVVEVKELPRKKAKSIDNGTQVIGDASVSSLSSSDGAFKDFVPPTIGKMSSE